MSDPNFGIIHFSSNPNETNVTVYKNGDVFTNYSTGNIIITSGLILNDIYEFHFPCHVNYSETGEGIFDVAQTQTMNPQNLNFGKISFGDLTQHIESQMQSIPLFQGQVNGTNNYRNIVHVNDHGGTIRQQPYSTELLNQLLVDIATNPYSSLQYTSANYEQFKERFKLKIRQLHDSLDINEPVYILVDKTLEALNLGKNSDSVFANSQMAMYRDYKSLDASWVINQATTFDLTKKLITMTIHSTMCKCGYKYLTPMVISTWKTLTKDKQSLLQALKLQLILAALIVFLLVVKIIYT